MSCTTTGVTFEGGKFKNGAITGAFSRLYNDLYNKVNSFGDALTNAKNTAGFSTRECRSSTYCKLSRTSNASYVHEDENGEFYFSRPAPADGLSLPNPAGMSTGSYDGSDRTTIWPFGQKLTPRALAVFGAHYTGVDYSSRFETLQNWANELNADVYFNYEVRHAWPNRGFEIKEKRFCPNGC